MPAEKARTIDEGGDEAAWYGPDCRDGDVLYAGCQLVDETTARQASCVGRRFNRLVATTERSNTASQAVMRRLGMSVEENPLPEPEWFQVVGWMEAGQPSA